MRTLNQLFIFVILTLAVTVCEKDPDEGRPYEFGFTIDGQQHRHEKKDKNGIIQGEFGFITADGVYHVTVYATDENGNFKILSMKNIRISAPLDGSPALGPISPEAGKYIGKQAQTTAQPVQKYERLQEAPVVKQQAVTENPKKYEFTTQPTIKPACAGCGLVSTIKPIAGQPFPFQTPAFKKPVGSTQDFGSKESDQKFGSIPQQQVGLQNPPQPSQSFVPEGQQIPIGNVGTFNANEQLSNVPRGPVYSNISPTTSQLNEKTHQNIPGGQVAPNVNLLPPGISTGPLSGNEGVNYPLQDQITQSQPNLPLAPGQLPPDVELLPPGSSPNGILPGNQNIPNNQQQYALYQQNGFQNNVQSSGPAQVQGPDLDPSSPYFGRIPPNSVTQRNQVSTLPPISVDGNVIHVGGKNPQNIPIKDKYPGMAEGLPIGVDDKDVKDILYKFKYTVGFHGHYEKGLRNGAKIGGYFVNGRDGISRVVTYIADENGYRPKFKFINLGLDSPDTPKEDTEKTFGLKDFEFVWYPIE